ncbi:MAG TPA: GNAT family N-acetyltransferase [Burkholderiales bacterium]
MQIRPTHPPDLLRILQTINDAARAYRNTIPADCWHDPYMQAEELTNEINDGVKFWAAEDNHQLIAVMGIQDKPDVALIRHAYTATSHQGKGAGTKLLRHVTEQTKKPVLIGTWAAATWAIAFYQRNGFTLVSQADKERLLRKYWTIPARQIETSVVLADEAWTNKQKTG